MVMIHTSRGNNGLAIFHLTMKNSIIRDNSAATWGGGGWLNQGSYQAVKFISNTADKGGGFGTEGIPNL